MVRGLSSPASLGLSLFLRAPNKTSWEPVNNERITVVLGSLAESARAEEKNHRGTEGTEKVCDLCASVPSVPSVPSVVQTS